VQPPIISSVRFWYMFQIILTGLAVAFGLYAVTQAPAAGAQPFVGSVMVVYYAIALAILIAAYILAGKRTSAGYYTVLVLSFLGLLALPLGTIVSIYILTKWFKPELKAWYGVP
ncbi:MAG: hypothetical protein LC772_03435, partial [Chloroflexi bacterium]|nr:hypothetical protein [Chloroflexota bacterium]